MPRDGSGIYTLPPGTKGVPDTTIESSKYNAFADDVASDANAVRPIIAGGTGASTAAGARAQLGVTSGAAQVTNYDSHVFETGSFWSSPTATAAPVASNVSGTAVVLNADPNYVTLDAVDNSTGLFWTRRKTGGVWSAWVKQDANDKVLKTGDTMTGPLSITADLTLQRAGAPGTGAIFFGNTGSHYLYHDAAKYAFAGGGLDVGGAVTAPSFNGPLNGNASSASTAAACSGNAASANVAASCSGNAASATTAASCSGNAATASYATTAGSAGSITAGGSLDLGAGSFIEGPYYIDMKHPGHGGEDYCARLLVNADHTLDITTPKLRGSGVVEAANGYRTNTGGNGGWQTFAFDWNTGAGGLILYITGTYVGPVSVTISDYRIKQNVKPLASMWDKVKALKPITYMHKEDGSKPNPLIANDGVERWGFAAHELQKTLTNSAATGAKDGEHLQSPNPWTVIAALTKSLQEAMGRIEALEAAR